MFKIQYPTDYLKKEGVNSKVAELSDEIQYIEQVKEFPQFKRYRRSDSESESRFKRIDVPGDGSCLFWSVTMAYLIPVRNDDALFRQRYEALFGNEEAVTQNLDHIRSLVRNLSTANYDDTFANLVRNVFRNRVVDHMSSHRNEFRDFVEGNFENYLESMRKPNTWGDEPEIRAMSKMLSARISVSGATRSQYNSGNTQIQLFHVGAPGTRNHYNFGLEQHVVDNDIELAKGLKKVVGKGRPQDFELIQLLIEEAGKEVGISRQDEDFKSFKTRFQSFVDQIPSYLHSVGKAGFFTHFFLGSFSTLLDTEMAKKLGIKEIYFRFDGAKTLKVAIIKNDEIKSQKDVINKVKLFVISESGSHSYTQEFDQGELKEVLGKHYSFIEDHLDKIKVKSIEIIKDAGHQGKIVVDVKDKGVDIEHNSEVQFKKVRKGLWRGPEVDIAKLAISNQRTVKASLRRIFDKIYTIHSEYADSLIYASRAREAAHHGFMVGVFMNFHYRYNLRVYPEQFAGRGYADIILLARGPDRALNSIPIIIELKAGNGPNLTPDKALEQAEKYAQGFQPNVQRVLTTADDILCVGVNLDNPSPISDIKVSNRGEEIIPLFQDMLKSADDWDTKRIGTIELKEQVKDNLERIYHTFPGTPEKGDNHYFSRFLLGQSLLLNRVEDLETGFKKYIFIYGDNIPTEVHPNLRRLGRPAAERARERLSTNLDASHAAVTIVLIPENTEKLVYVINIVEANRKDVLDKGLPLDRLKREIGDRKIVELNLNFDTRYKSKFERYLTVKANEPISLEQYNERGVDKFQGTFKNVPYPNELKETFDKALDAQSSSVNEYNRLLEKIGEGIFPFKTLVNKEAHFQGILNGAFSYYSDLKLQESPETRALVLTEFQTGRGERIDMLVHGIKFVAQGRNAEEYTPIGLELKTSRQGKGAKDLLKEANDQINKEYEKGVTYKTLTDGDEVKFIGVVFDKGAHNANSLILTSRTNEEGFISVDVIHSSEYVLLDVGQCSGRNRRSIGMICVDSRDEEDITEEEKEQRIKELLSDKMMMKIKLKKLESEISDEVLNRSEEVKSVDTYRVNKSALLSYAIKSLELSKILLLISQKSEVSTELQRKAYYNTLIDIGALVYDHKNHVHGDHLSALESRIQGNQLLSVAHDLYYLSKNEGNVVDQDKLYSDQIKNRVSSYSYVEDKSKADAIYSELSDIDIKDYFSDNNVENFYTEAEAYNKEVMTIHSSQVFADGIEVYVSVKDNNDNHQKVVIGDAASIQNTENYILDDGTAEIKFKTDDGKEYIIAQELEGEDVKHYLNTPDGYKVKVGDIISSFTENENKVIRNKLSRLELSASVKGIEEISNAEITDQDYNSVVDEIKQNLLQKGVREDTFDRLKNHLDSLSEKVFGEYVSDVEKELESHGAKFDRGKFNLAKGKAVKGGKFFSLMAIYDLFDSTADVSTLGRHDNDALKQIFGMNGILDALDDVRESLSTQYMRPDGSKGVKLSRNGLGKITSKIPGVIRKGFVKIINNPVVQGITFVTIAYQFGYSINEIAQGNHHPLNYYWTISSGTKLASMSIRPISMGVSFAMKGVSITPKVLRGLLIASKVLGKLSMVTAVVDILITIGIEIYEGVEYTRTIAKQVPLLPGGEQAEVFFSWRGAREKRENEIKIKNYLSFLKETAIKLLNDDYSIAAVVWYISSIEEKYSQVIKSVGLNKQVPCILGSSCPMAVVWLCEVEESGNFSFENINMISDVKGNLSSTNISEALPMMLHSLSMGENLEIFTCAIKGRNIVECYIEVNYQKVYIINTDAKHIPHMTRYEYENLGLRIIILILIVVQSNRKQSRVV